MFSSIQKEVVVNDVSNSGMLRDLAELSEIQGILRTEFSKLYNLDIPECTIRFLTKKELDDDYKATGNPLRRSQIVAFAKGVDIAFNPNSESSERIKFLAHELGHCTLDNHKFHPEEYLDNGLMGPKRVYHEAVAKIFEQDGESILKEKGVIPNSIISRMFGFRGISLKLSELTESSPIKDLLKKDSISMKDILCEAEDILSAHLDMFSPRRYF